MPATTTCYDRSTYSGLIPLKSLHRNTGTTLSETPTELPVPGVDDDDFLNAATVPKDNTPSFSVLPAIKAHARHLHREIVAKLPLGQRTVFSNL